MIIEFEFEGMICGEEHYFCYFALKNFPMYDLRIGEKIFLEDFKQFLHKGSFAFEDADILQDMEIPECYDFTIVEITHHFNKTEDQYVKRFALDYVVQK